MDYTTLMDLVKLYSPTGHEAQASTWLVERMQHLGFTNSFVDPVGNAVGIMGSGSRQIVLLGHIDTVPGNLPVKVEAGILYGRGSVDAKGPLACFTDAVASLGGQADWQVVVIGAVEEEGDSIGARSILEQYHPEYLIVGEPNRWDRMALGYKGSAWMRLEVEREQAHSAGSSETACEVAVQAWLNVKSLAEQFNQGKTRLFDQILVNLGEMKSGSDGMKQWANVGIGARLPLELSPDGWYDLVRSGLPGVKITSSKFPIPAWQCDKNTPLVRALLAGIRARGGTPSFVYKTGTADLNIVAPVWKCPATVYGPGDSNLDHSPGECIVLEEYEKSVCVLTDALRRITDQKV